MISDKFIRSRAKNEMTYRAGIELYAENKIEQISFDIIDPETEHGAMQPANTFAVKSINSHNVSRTGTRGNTAGKTKDEQKMHFTCSCYVSDGSKNKVIIEADESGDDVSYSCSCPSYWATWGACKHIVAAMKKVYPVWEERTREAFTHKKSEENQEFFGSLRQILSEGTIDREGKINVHVSPFLKCEIDRDGQISIKLEISAGKEKQYLIKDLRQFLNMIEEKKPIEFSKLFTYDQEKMTFDYKSKQLIWMLRSYYMDETALIATNETSRANYAKLSLFDGRVFKMGNAALANFFDIFQDDEVEFQFYPEKPKNITISSSPMPLLKDNLENGFGFILSKYWKNHVQFLIKGDMAIPISQDCKYIIYRNTLYRVGNKLATLLKPILGNFAKTKNKPLIIADIMLENFYSDILLPLQHQLGVYVDPAISQRIEVIMLEGHIKIDQDKSTLIVRPEFLYKNKDEERINVYDKSGEKVILHLLEKYGFINFYNNEENLFACSKEEQIYSFLTKGIPALQDIATIYYSDNFKPMKKINASMLPQISFGLEGDLFEVSMDFDGLSYAEIQECIKGYRMKKHYYRLKTGEFLNLDSKEFVEFSEMLDGLGLKEKDIKPQPIILPLYRSLYLGQMETNFETLRITKKDTFINLIKQMKEYENESDCIPASLVTTLREYQKQGVMWLNRLHRFGFGGILADDMGLGKTLQVLSFLVSEKAKDDMPSLVVAPTSLVYNWEAEVKKFAPQIKTLLIHGSVSERDEKLAQIGDADLIITSYALLRRDIDKYQSIHFKACIIDEAQNIKNPKTINSKSVKQVSARTYFALTGTPIENSLTELWSIFDFLMPGYLFTHAKFQEQFEIPIFKDKEQSAITRLKHLVSPFILRRMKKDVLTELPEKINSVLYNEMTTEQSKLYASYVLTAKTQFHKLLNDDPAMSKNRFEILSLLTRLRQLCCHPSLFIEDYTGESGKLEQAMELISEALSGQHRILIFSQFTSMLEKVKEKLDAMNLEYFYLDGKTPTAQRRNYIDAFQAGERSLFLLSLKAGGTGLNLTGADMVIHMDPWWNPAVEDQATDRVYRIGQTNRVQVFKLITKDTIEEKIFALQEKKNAFVSEMIRFDEENPIFSLNQQDLLSLFDGI